MENNLAFGAIAFTSLLVVYNPLSAIPIFVALTLDDTNRERRTTAIWGVVTSVIVLLLFAFAGSAILGFFDITTEAFQITAGAIFFGIGSDMLQAKRSRVKTTRQEQDEAANRKTLAIIPLGLPTLSGPGSIVTMIALTGQAENPVQLFWVYAAAVFVGLVTLPVLILAPTVLNTLGRTGVNVVTRIMGLMVMVVGVQFVIDGVGSVVGAWSVTP